MPSEPKMTTWRALPYSLYKLSDQRRAGQSVCLLVADQVHRCHCCLLSYQHSRPSLEPVHIVHLLSNFAAHTKPSYLSTEAFEFGPLVLPVDLTSSSERPLIVPPVYPSVSLLLPTSLSQTLFSSQVLVVLTRLLRASDLRLAPRHQRHAPSRQSRTLLMCLQHDALKKGAQWKRRRLAFFVFTARETVGITNRDAEAPPCSIVQPSLILTPSSPHPIHTGSAPPHRLRQSPSLTFSLYILPCNDINRCTPT